jgi:hypothetical protein
MRATRSGSCCASCLSLCCSAKLLSCQSFCMDCCRSRSCRVGRCLGRLPPPLLLPPPPLVLLLSSLAVLEPAKQNKHSAAARAHTGDSRKRSRPNRQLNLPETDALPSLTSHLAALLRCCQCCLLLPPDLHLCCCCHLPGGRHGLLCRTSLSLSCLAGALQQAATAGS